MKGPLETGYKSHVRILVYTRENNVISFWKHEVI